MNAKYDAIIIGGGPAGSSTAILLARKGWRVALIERAAFPRRKVCGECIAASNMPLLDALGVGPALARRAGAPLHHVALNWRNQTIRAKLPALDHPCHPWGYAVGREDLDTLLLAQARSTGASVFCPWAARDVGGVPGQMFCDIKNAQTQEVQKLQAPLVICANGSWEVSGASSKPLQDSPKRKKDSDLFAFKANFESQGQQADLLPVLSFKGGYGGMVVQGRSVTTWAFCIRRDTLARCRQAMPRCKAAEAAAAYVQHACADVDTMLAHSRQLGPWLAAGPIRPGIRIYKGGEGIFLVGNAAGEAHPIIGEGISMAIQSAFLLAEILLAQDMATFTLPGKQPAIHQRYASAWRQAFALRIRLAGVFAYAAMRPSFMAATFPILRRYPSMLTYAARRSGKVNFISGNLIKAG